MFAYDNIIFGPPDGVRDGPDGLTYNEVRDLYKRNKRLAIRALIGRIDLFLLHEIRNLKLGDDKFSLFTMCIIATLLLDYIKNRNNPCEAPLGFIGKGLANRLYDTFFNNVTTLWSFYPFRLNNDYDKTYNSESDSINPYLYAEELLNEWEVYCMGIENAPETTPLFKNAEKYLQDLFMGTLED